MKLISPMRVLCFLPRFVVGLLMVFFIQTHTFAQTPGDSLRRVLEDETLPAGKRLETLRELARYAFFNKGKNQSIKLLKQALVESEKLKDTKYLAKTHAQLSFTYRIVGQPEIADKHLDSALLYANRTTDKETKGYLQYVQGWTLIRKNESQGASRHLFEALRLLENSSSYEIRQSVYYELAGMYGNWNDYENFERYARLCLSASQRTGSVDDLSQAWQVLASCYEDRFRHQENRRDLVDSALLFNKRSYSIAQQNWDDLVIKSQLPFTANNIAALYLEFYNETYKDSVTKYVHIAINLAKETKQHSVEASGYGILSEYAIADGDYDKAITYLNAAFLELSPQPMADEFILSQICKNLALCYEKKGDMVNALHYQKEYLNFYQAVFDAQKMATAKEMEARYQSELKEKALIKAKYETAEKEKALLLSRYTVEKQKQDLLTAELETAQKEKALAISRFQTQEKEQELIKAQFQTNKQRQHLSVLEQQIAYGKKLKTIYIALAVAGLLSVFVLAYAYRQRTKALRQKEQLHAFEVDKIKQEHRISLLSVMLEGQEKERTRLARDLHDGLGGLLSGIKMEFSEITSLLSSEKPRQLVNRTLGRLDDAVDELRRIAHSMMPELLLKYGLAEATREFCGKLNGTKGPKVLCQVINVSNDMPHSRQVVLYRIMQESVNNALKHADASEILVQLQQSAQNLSLTVEDDGKGMDNTARQQFNGAGLANIKSRVEFLGGQLEWDSQPGTGTSINVECTII